MKVKVIETNTLFKENLTSIIIWFVLALPTFVFLFYSLSIVISFIDERMKLMSLIFFMYICLKLLYWVGIPKIYTSSSWNEEIKDKIEEVTRCQD